MLEVNTFVVQVLTGFSQVRLGWAGIQRVQKVLAGLGHSNRYLKAGHSRYFKVHSFVGMDFDVHLRLLLLS